MEGAYDHNVPFLSAPATLQNALIGPCVAGYQVQFILFGILVQQVISYRDELRTHTRLSQATALVVLVLNIAYTAICFEDGYNLAASSDRTVITLFNGSLEWQFLPLLNGFIAAAAEAFLTLRAGAFFLDKRAKWIFYGWQACLIFLVLFGSIASFAEGVIGFYYPYRNDVINYNTAVSIWLWACAAADTSISIALAYTLSQRIAHFNHATDSVLRKLILIGLRTASFTAILSVIGAVMSSIYSGWDPSKVDIPIAFWVPTGALYGISLFTTLSSTRQVVEKRLASSSSAAAGGGVRPPSFPGSPRPPPPLASKRSFHTSSSSGRAISRLSGHYHHHHERAVIPLEISVHREVVRNVDVDEEKSDLRSSFEQRASRLG
ncbi:hypothetical protein JCM3766R1_000753 [Sporobolomyces carnicolor]